MGCLSASFACFTWAYWWGCIQLEHSLRWKFQETELFCSLCWLSALVLLFLCHVASLFSSRLDYMLPSMVVWEKETEVEVARSLESWALNSHRVASLSFVGQSKSQDQPRFKMRGNRIHLLMGGVAVTLHWSMERLVASIFEDSLPHDHTQFSCFTSVCSGETLSQKQTAQGCSLQNCL